MPDSAALLRKIVNNFDFLQKSVFKGCLRSADNPFKNLPEDEVEEWLLIDEKEPARQELTLTTL